MNFVGNVPKRGHLSPGTPTPEDCPIGFIKTCQTGDFEFMYFKDYSITQENGIIFKTFEEEFLTETRSYDTEYKFHAAFIRIPNEFIYVAINEVFDTTTNLELRKDKNIYSGLTLININNPEELEAPCSQAYFEFYKHYETFTPEKDNGPNHSRTAKKIKKSSFLEFFDEFYPFPPKKAKTESSDDHKKIDINSPLGVMGNTEEGISKEEKTTLATNHRVFGCEIPIYIGKDKPVIFQFNQEKGDTNTSYMLMVLGTDNVIAFIEATKEEDIAEYINVMKDPIYITKSENGHKEKKILGIKNLSPITYGPYRFNHSYGVHYLLSRNVDGHAEGGWDYDKWDIIKYYDDETPSV